MRTPIKPVQNPNVVMENYKEKKAIKHGNETIEPMLPKSFVSYPVMIAIMAVLQAFSIIYGRQFVLFFGFNGSYGSVVLLPMVVYIFQIASECYGWQYARQLVFCNLLVNMIAVLVCLVGNYLPFSQFNHAELQKAYITLMGTMWVSALINCVGVFLSDYIGSILMCWSRFQLSGKFVMARILILHLLSEVILLTGGFISLKYNHYSDYDIIKMLTGAFMARTSIALILLPVARVVIWAIQHKVEHVIVFDLKFNINPFKLNIDNNNSVQFSVGGSNDNNQVGNIDMKKLAQAYSNLIIEEQQQKRVNHLTTANSLEIHNHHNSNVVS